MGQSIMSRFWISRFWPKSPKARRRLTLFLVIAPVVILAAGLALFALKDGVVYFYSPAQALEAHLPLGKPIRLGGLVAKGSVIKGDNGQLSFRLMDKKASLTVVYQGSLPDLFREGQGVVCEGALIGEHVFKASLILAKHDEKYMPKEVTKALKAQGEWRPDQNTGNSQ